MRYFISQFNFFMLGLFLFLGISNTMSNMPLDKAGLLIFSCSFLLSAVFKIGRLPVSGFVPLWVSLFFIFLFSAFSLFSIGEIGGKIPDLAIIFFFMLNLILVFLVIELNSNIFMRIFLFSVVAYLLFGIFSWLYSVSFGRVYFVQPLYGKGMPGIYGALSFSTTQQVFATFAAFTMMVLVFLKRNFCDVRFFRVIFIICAVSIVISLNRVWILFLFVAFSFLIGRNVWLAILPASIVGAILSLLYSDVMLAFGTVQSRFMMMSNLYDFWIAQDYIHIFFGRPFYSGSYFFMHGRFFEYIESGPFFLLINFGLLGFLMVSLLFLCVTYAAFRQSSFLGFFCFYYLFFVQFMTQEFLSVSFWLFWVVIVCIFNIEKNKFRRV